MERSPERREESWKVVVREIRKMRKEFKEMMKEIKELREYKKRLNKQIEKMKDWRKKKENIALLPPRAPRAAARNSIQEAQS